MINDASVLAEIRRAWGGVEALKGKLDRSAKASGASGIFPFSLADAAQNLPFLLACCVLDDTLKAFEIENKFTAHKKTFGGRIFGSEHAMNWIDFSMIKEILKKRNDLAHHGKILNRKECWNYIDAIKVELTAWNIISP